MATFASWDIDLQQLSRIDVKDLEIIRTMFQFTPTVAFILTDTRLAQYLLVLG